MNTSLWKKRETLTIEQAVILALGNDPYNTKFIDSQTEAISDLIKKLSDCVKLDKRIVNKLIKQKYHEQGDELAALQSVCSELGVTFFKSITKDDFAILDQSIYPDESSIELDAREIKAWFKSIDIRPEFFFPENYDDDYSLAKSCESEELNGKERDTLLVLLGAALKANKIDYEQKGIASAVQKMTEIIGVSISEDTIRKNLKMIPDAVERRSK